MTTGPWFWAWRFSPLTVAALLAVASLYALGVVRVRRRGGAVPTRRVVWWYAGIAVATLALVSPIDAYADVSFTDHMVQHLLLTLVVPPLLALGAPIVLALRALRPEHARRLASTLRSNTVRVLTSPVVGWALLVGVSWVVHESSLFDAALGSGAWHALEHGVWLGAALVYWWPIVGVDPMPHPVSHPVRLLSLFLLMPAMSFLALAIYGASSPVYPSYAELPPPWGPAALASQQEAGVIMWVAGTLAIVVAMLFVAADWKRTDDARQRREEARSDAREALRGRASTW
jgi:cytochrome c oxidase assembly factor CtaG